MMVDSSRPFQDIDVHQGIIESLATQYEIDQNVVRSLYEDEFSKLAVNSRIKAFLPVLCTRHVKLAILQTQRS